MAPLAPTPEWAIDCMERINKYDDPEVLVAAMQLLAGVVADKDADKFKHEAAWAAIYFGFTKTGKPLRKAAREYLGVAV